MEIISPLEELSEAYACKGPHSLADSWEEKIFDDVKNQILYIVPAGFTQRNNEGRNRKSYYKAVYQKAITFNTEKKLNPFALIATLSYRNQNLKINTTKMQYEWELDLMTIIKHHNGLNHKCGKI